MPMHKVGNCSLKKPRVKDVVQQLNDYINSIDIGKTGDSWIQHIYHVNICLTLITAVKSDNFHLCRQCLLQICD